VSCGSVRLTHGFAPAPVGGIAGSTYHNTYAWFMTLSGGKVIDGTAFYDSIVFNELWNGVTP
jgi:hypothetical protein